MISQVAGRDQGHHVVVDDERHIVFLLEFDVSCETAFKASLPFLGINRRGFLIRHLLSPLNWSITELDLS